MSFPACCHECGSRGEPSASATMPSPCRHKLELSRTIRQSTLTLSPLSCLDHGFYHGNREVSTKEVQHFVTVTRKVTYSAWEAMLRGDVSAWYS